MGGFLKVVHIIDGKEYIQIRNTNPLPEYVKSNRFIRGDVDYMKLYIEKSPIAEEAKLVTPESYGIIYIDFDKKLIVDAQNYCDLKFVHKYDLDLFSVGVKVDFLSEWRELWDDGLLQMACIKHGIHEYNIENNLTFYTKEELGSPTLDELYKWWEAYNKFSPHPDGEPNPYALLIDWEAAGWTIVESNRADSGQLKYDAVRAARELTEEEDNIWKEWVEENNGSSWKEDRGYGTLKKEEVLSAINTSVVDILGLEAKDSVRLEIEGRKVFEQGLLQGRYYSQELVMFLTQEFLDVLDPKKVDETENIKKLIVEIFSSTFLDVVMLGGIVRPYIQDYTDKDKLLSNVAFKELLNGREILKKDHDVVFKFFKDFAFDASGSYNLYGASGLSYTFFSEEKNVITRLPINYHTLGMLVGMDEYLWMVIDSICIGLKHGKIDIQKDRYYTKFLISNLSRPPMERQIYSYIDSETKLNNNHA